VKIIILISANNDAFQEDASGETARILRELASRIERHPHFSEGHDQALYDDNGNEVGFCTVAADSQKWEL